MHVFSGFGRDVRVDEICALLGYYAALSGSSVPMFRDNVSVPSSRVKKSLDSLYRSTTQRCVISEKSADLKFKILVVRVSIISYYLVLIGFALGSFIL
jgi:hypothetical protein